MKQILLSQDKIALVDDADYPSLMLFKWYAKKSGNPEYDNWYAVRKEHKNTYSLRGQRQRHKPDPRKTIRMHNVIVKPQRGNIAHHLDGNGLNNQRYNLEECTELKNQQVAGAKTNGQCNKVKDDIRQLVSEAGTPDAIAEIITEIITEIAEEPTHNIFDAVFGN